MAAPQKNDYTLDEMEAKYTAVTQLYDLADELLATAESPFVSDAQAQLNVVEPLIAEIADATEVLSEEFILIAEGRHGGAKKANKARVENAFRRVFAAISDYQERVKSTGKTLKNIADPIVAKIQRHVEEVVVIFIEFIQVSLAAIMHKQQLEAVRLRNPRIALMMHQQSLSQQ